MRWETLFAKQETIRSNYCTTRHPDISQSTVSISSFACYFSQRASWLTLLSGHSVFTLKEAELFSALFSWQLCKMSGILHPVLSYAMQRNEKKSILVLSKVLTAIPVEWILKHHWLASHCVPRAQQIWLWLATINIATRSSPSGHTAASISVSLIYLHIEGSTGFTEMISSVSMSHQLPTNTLIFIWIIIQ